MTDIWTLVEKAQGGDAESFGLIYDRYVDTVFRFVYYRVGNRQVAEDLTSDVFLRALKNIGSLINQGRDPGAWLVTIARNLVADHFKAARTRLDSGEDPPERVAADDPAEEVISGITSDVLRGCVQQLPPDQRRCIALRFFYGLSVAETAERMDKNEGAIKALQYRAVRALARLLPDELGEVA